MLTCQQLPCYVPSKLHFQQGYIRIINFGMFRLSFIVDTTIWFLNTTALPAGLYQNNKFRNASSQFYRRHYDLVSKYDARLKSLLLQGLSKLEFYVEKVYKGRVTLLYCDVPTSRSNLENKLIQKQILHNNTLVSLV